MTRRVITDQWHDHTQPPVIVWAYTGVWELQPVAVDQVGPEADEYSQLTRAWYAAKAYYNEEELEEEARFNGLTMEQANELYGRGDGSAEAAGLPREYYAEGVNKDGSDAIIYVDEATEFATYLETLEEATPRLYPEDVAEINQAVTEARQSLEEEGAPTMPGYGPLYIKPIPLKTTEEERRAGYDYAREHFHQIEVPENSAGNWEYFTTDPTNRHAPVYSIARPGKGAESSRFGDNEYTAAILEEHAAHLIKDADTEIALANYCTAHEQPAKAEEHHQAARRSRERSKEYSAAAQRIKKQWTR